jgi:hypothetical protein
VRRARGGAGGGGGLVRSGPSDPGRSTYDGVALPSTTSCAEKQLAVQCSRAAVQAGRTRSQPAMPCRSKPFLYLYYTSST